MKRFLLIGFCLIAGSVSAQTNLSFYNFRSVGQTNFLNPAINSRQAFTLGVLDNYNHYYLPQITARDVFRSDEPADTTIVKLLRNDAYQFKDIHLYNEINPLFFGMRFKKNYISFGLQVSLNHRLSIPKVLLNMFYFGNTAPENFGKEIKVSDLQVNVSSYASAYLSYSREINEKLTIGIKGKYHIGIYNGELLRNVSSFKTDSGQNNAYRLSATTDYEMRGAGLDRMQSLVTAGSNQMQFGLDYLNKPVGSGFSVDLGMNYKVNNKLSISASVLDLGYINWKETTNYSRKASFVFEGFLTEDPTKIDSVTLKNLKDSVTEIFKPVQTAGAAYRTYFSPKIYVGTQYNLYNSGTIGLLGFGEIWNGKLYAGASVSYTQRIWRILDLRVNYNIYRQQYTNLGAGFSLNLGPMVIYALSDNILGLVSIDGVKQLQGHYSNSRIGLNFNIGGRFDRDNDGVPDRKDKCKKIPGLIKFDGCPDTDNDSVPESRDECPDVKGSILANGCPDFDGDGVKDAADSCMDVKGSIKTNGCPDEDGDGVADKLDACPKDFGPIQTKGCPDRDGDGVPDKTDACPEIPGTIENKGCPEKGK